MTPLDTLHHTIKQAIVRSLASTRLTPADIGTTQPLFGGEGLGLDSVDGLELAFEIEECFGVEIPDDDDHRPVFTSVHTIAEYLVSQRPGLLESGDCAG